MDTRTQATPGRARCRVAPTALALLESARHGLANAADETSVGGRYVAAHLAALRAAAAIVAARPAPGTGRRRKAPPSVWALLPRAVSGREADDLLRDAETFLSLAEEALGVPAQPVLPLRCTG